MVDFVSARKARKILKEKGFISSTTISGMISSGKIKIPFTPDIFFRKTRRLVQESDEFFAIKFIVSGTVKWWYPAKDIDRIVKAVTS